MRIALIILALCSLFPSLSAQQTCREVIAYYPNWQWYDRGNLVNPQSIDYSLYSILNYAFFNVLNDGSILSTDPWADKNLLLGPINWNVAPAGYESSYDFGNPDYHLPNQQFSDYCQQYDVKLLPSVGGWTLSSNFPVVAADPVKRQHFAQQCVELVNAYDFDGVDIDWEYPGYAPHGGSPDDAGNFTALLQELREKLDSLETELDKELLLTIAVGASPENMENVQWSSVAELVDIINLMSYDYFGAWDNMTNHNAPLYQPASGNPEFNTDASLTRLIDQYNVPPSKIALGIGFYGRSVQTIGEPALHVPSNGIPDTETFPVDQGSPLYYSIVNALPAFDYHWDDLAQVPFLTGVNGLNTFVSFDDTLSVALKAEYALDYNLRGVIIWELTGDYIETEPGSGVILETPLASKIKSIFCEEENLAGCPGDFDMDGVVWTADLLFILQDYGCSGECTGDLDGDGAVTGNDIILFLAVYDSVCAQ